MFRADFVSRVRSGLQVIKNQRCLLQLATVLDCQRKMLAFTALAAVKKTKHTAFFEDEEKKVKICHGLTNVWATMTIQQWK